MSIIRPFAQGAAFGCMIVALVLHLTNDGTSIAALTWLAISATWSLVAIANKD